MFPALAATLPARHCSGLQVEEAPAPYSGAAQPRLFDRIRAHLRSRHYSRRTEKVYISWILRYMFFCGKRHPSELGATEVTAFLSHLATDRNVSASTQNQALSAILFLYREVLAVGLPWLDGLVRARKPARLPAVLTPDEVRAVLSCMTGAPRLMVSLLYGSGLRLLECARLRVKHVDLGAGRIHGRSGKGDRDCITLLPAVLSPPLERHLRRVREQHRRDLEKGAGFVELPSALGRKLRGAATEWAWQWTFPATRTYIDGTTLERRRHHLHETVVQRAVKATVRTSGVSKRTTSHIQTFIRHPSSGRWVRHPDRAGTPRRQGCPHDDDLHPRPEQGVGRSQKPDGSTGMTSTPDRKAPSAGPHARPGIDRENSQPIPADGTGSQAPNCRKGRKFRQGEDERGMLPQGRGPQDSGAMQFCRL